MKDLKLSEDQLIISQHKANSSYPVRNYSETIPLDLLMDIFSRVPAKSIARFRCVSKFWASILARHDFTDLFLTKSSNRPQILFVVKCNAEFYIFSSTQPQNPDENCSLVATRYKYYQNSYLVRNSIFQHLLGLVYLCKSFGRHFRGLRVLQWIRHQNVICNPITRELLILPKPQRKYKGSSETSYLCYDPTKKQFKMFYMIWSCVEGHVTHLVMTLETRRRSWRRIECKPYSLGSGNGDGICINGMLYYKADDTIVCFDVRYEKLNFISINVYHMFEDKLFWNLTNYKGKLGVHLARIRKPIETEFVLWVLEDAENNKWSKNICVLTPFFNKDIEYSVGVTCGGEIVFSPDSETNPFYIIYYNFERNTFTRVEIQGLSEAVDGRTYIETFLNYVENMKLMKFRSEDEDECRRSKRPRNPNPNYY